MLTILYNLYYIIINDSYELTRQYPHSYTTTVGPSSTKMLSVYNEMKFHELAIMARAELKNYSDFIFGNGKEPRS